MVGIHKIFFFLDEQNFRNCFNNVALSIVHHRWVQYFISGGVGVLSGSPFIQTMTSVKYSYAAGHFAERQTVNTEFSNLS